MSYNVAGRKAQAVITKALQAMSNECLYLNTIGFYWEKQDNAPDIRPASYTVKNTKSPYATITISVGRKKVVTFEIEEGENEDPVVIEKINNAPALCDWLIAHGWLTKRRLHTALDQDDRAKGTDDGVMARLVM